MDIFKKFFLDTHYKMERFAIMFTILAVLMSSVVLLAFVKDKKKASKILRDKAIYTESFTSSRTNTTGKFDSIYRSKDGKRVLLLLKYDDVSAVSTNANNYQCFLTSSDVKGNTDSFTNKPAGSIYMFGTSGYMGIYLNNAVAFEPQIMQLTIRANKEIKNAYVQTKNKEDKSFDDHDQFSIIFNPSVTDVKHLAELDKEKPNGGDLFKEVTRKEKQVTAVKLKAKLLEMERALSMIDEYEDRVSNIDNIQLPDRPAVISNDVLDIERSKSGDFDNLEFDDYAKYEISKEDYIEVNRIESFVYKPSLIVSGGYDFDWWSNINDNHIDKLIAESDNPDATYDQFFAAKAIERRSGRDDMGNLANIEWVLKDGTKLNDLKHSEASGAYKTISKDCNELINSYNNYYTLKRGYQTSLEDILSLEAQSKLVGDSVTVNYDKNALKLY